MLGKATSGSASKQVVAIVGPTAVGKSALADAVAARLGSSVVSADSMQVYRGMDIGTAKAKPCECQSPLLLVDVVDPGTPYSAALYQCDARAAIDTLICEGKVPVLCGGTGLYVRAALDEMSFPSGEVDGKRRLSYQNFLNDEGEAALYSLLVTRDPASAELIHPHNSRRVIRAHEMLDEGTSYASQHKGFDSYKEHYSTAYFALTMNRELLYERINRRVDIMFEQGLVDEVELLVKNGYEHALTSMQAIGYKEIIEALRGSFTLDEACELIKMRSRRYAKRQLSWFKRDKRMTWINLDEISTSQALEIICSTIA